MCLVKNASNSEKYSIQMKLPNSLKNLLLRQKVFCRTSPLLTILKQREFISEFMKLKVGNTVFAHFVFYVKNSGNVFNLLLFSLNKAIINRIMQKGK